MARIGSTARSTVAWVAGSLAVVLVALYVLLDVQDAVPGVLTDEPAPADAAPYPAVALPGARPAAAPVDLLDPAAPAATPDAVGSAVESLVADPARPGDVAVRVVDSATGEVLAERDPTSALQTASSAKILTGAAALSVLGPQTRFPTTVVSAGDGLLVLVGGGDVLLGEGEGDPSATRGHAGIADLADQVAAELESSGTTEVRLAVDDSQFTGEPYADDVTGWDRSFTMPATTVAVNTGAVDGAYTADPAMGATEALAAALEERGVTATVEGRATAPDGASAIATTESAPVEQIVRTMLVDSDNAIADVLARMVALASGLPGDATSGGTAVVDAVGALGIDTAGTVMIDGAGLSITDSTTVTVLTELVDLALDPSATTLAGLVPALPTSGLDGTLSERLVGENAGRVQAKTGTLARSVSLTGTVLTADERLLTFSVVMHSFDEGGAWAARESMDTFVSELAACGCA
ncbi:D-alanyl-D-alanine carboxypeptidase/D-alanyl-D-alanine-endopeptidase [Georgenia sp. Z1344]|uniref:D-alanyl-D-alanine carboxypeptidase/D-alanyl-D-alanine-endopeptidase n=1 Tax=Georgenia sp. Z1344 TaxID=3416706 RepID=UPI003CF3AB6B